MNNDKLRHLKQMASLREYLKIGSSACKLGFEVSQKIIIWAIGNNKTQHARWLNKPAAIYCGKSSRPSN